MRWVRSFARDWDIRAVDVKAPFQGFRFSCMENPGRRCAVPWAGLTRLLRSALQLSFGEIGSAPCRGIPTRFRGAFALVSKLCLGTRRRAQLCFGGGRSRRDLPGDI